MLACLLLVRSLALSSLDRLHADAATQGLAPEDVGQPEAQALAKVVGWAQEIAVDDAAAKAASQCVHAAPGDSADVLLGVAGVARAASDGFDPDSQTLNHLLMLLFEERRIEFLQSQADVSEVIATLAEDFDAVAGFKGMSEGQLEAEVQPPPLTGIRSRYGLSGLAQYYLGLTKAAALGPSALTRALVFAMSFGGGHKSAASAVQGYLNSAGFESETIDTTYDPGFEDPGRQAYATVFNDVIMKNQLYGAQNWIMDLQSRSGPRYAPCSSPKCNTARKHQFRSAVLRRRPSLLVTVYYMELLPILEIAKDLGNLAVIHIATDMDTRMGDIFTPSTFPVYPRFLAGIPFDVDQSIAAAFPLDRKHMFLSGYPVRKEFLEPYSEIKVRAGKAKLAPAGTTVLLVMSGGGGQVVPWPYNLAQHGIGEPLHIIVVAAGNLEVAAQLRRTLSGNVTFPDGRSVLQGEDRNVTVEVATDPDAQLAEAQYLLTAERVASLMDACDVILTKPGGGSTAEVAYRGIPAIFDVSRPLLHWEQFTVDIFKARGRGLSFEGEASLRPTLARALALGRSTSLAEASSGSLLDPGERIPQAARAVLDAPCQNCRPLSSDVSS